LLSLKKQMLDFDRMILAWHLPVSLPVLTASQGNYGMRLYGGGIRGGDSARVPIQSKNSMLKGDAAPVRFDREKETNSSEDRAL